ncbi:lysis protein [Pseudomonas sp. RIT-PI-q]|uniref:lysis system i-spanin subunit Rz n=1 Tax=Pseudomonas sp. RIT-PI-q TaxID=1690247 RepID=UPI0006CDDAF3|nr:lysis system i-spanin subunit Rz [Pseudomonas sp. RIT-PI-q]KPG92917.1 lysis protein [Pseudomonas sp. RIT-PI-q]
MTIPPLRLAVFLLLSALLVWAAFDQVSDQLSAARRDRDSAQLEVTGLREAARISGEMLAARDEIDLQRTQELSNALNQNDDLRLAVDAGSQRLRLAATCSTPKPAQTGAGSVADAGTAELTANARSDYFTLRDQLALSRQMILGLQDHVRRICLR